MVPTDEHCELGAFGFPFRFWKSLELFLNISLKLSDSIRKGRSSTKWQ